MDEGTIGLIVLIIIGFVLSIITHIKTKNNSYAILIPALAGSGIFHLFAFLYDGAKAIKFLLISFPIGAFIIAIISSVVGLFANLIRRKMENKY